MGRPKKTLKIKEPVHIREMKLKDGNLSLYLDIYHKGVRKYEFLKLYLVPETDFAAKAMNAQTRKVAEKIKAERILALQNHGIDDWNNIKRSSMPLTTWLTEYENETANLALSTVLLRKKAHAKMNEFLMSIHRPTLALDELTKELCKDFVAFLRNASHNCYKDKTAATISQNTAGTYLSKISAALNKAVQEGIISVNPFCLLEARERIQQKESDREFLTKEELQRAIATPAYNDNVKRAFLFSCFTGLRLSEIRSFTPSKIHLYPDGKTRYVETIMEKTHKKVVVPLSQEALKWLPETLQEDQPVFTLPVTASNISKIIACWMRDAGIDKHITYHCSRHTFGTLMLTLGSDLYTTSKLMGHSNIRTTEIYAKIVDQKKIDSIALLDKLYD